MKFRAPLLAALGLSLLAGVVTTACTSPDRAFGPEPGATSGSGGAGGVGAGTAGSAGSTMSTGTGTTTTIPCAEPSDCAGKETECQTRTCIAGFCGLAFSPSGVSIATQFSGDCLKIVCDGQGAVAEHVDDTDVPDDSNPCTQDACSAGVPSHPPVAFGTSCGGALTCNSQGQCTGCASPGECPGLDTDCQTRSCTGTVCGFLYQQSGTKVTEQTPSDCKQNVCNGVGAVSVTFDTTDPGDDGNPCTLDGCTNGSPTHDNLAAGAPCLDPSKPVCNGGGACVECVTASTCQGQDDECKTRACVAGSCTFTFTASGTPVAFQKTGDCHKSVCDGAGSVTQAVDDTDVQQDSNVCTTDSCNNGTSVHAPVAVGTDCGAPKKCDATGKCSGCLTSAECPGQDTECQKRTCTTGVCGYSFTASNTPVAVQTASDCKKNVCNGTGAIVSVADSADVLSDGNQCTTDACKGGAPIYPPTAPGTACSMGGGTVCNGVGGCGVCKPGAVDICACPYKSLACCNKDPLPIASDGAKLQSDGDDPTSIPDSLLCCCEGARNCDATGQWGLCQ